jgi:hypothetical protein
VRGNFEGWQGREEFIDAVHAKIEEGTVDREACPMASFAHLHTRPEVA